MRYMLCTFISLIALAFFSCSTGPDAAAAMKVVPDSLDRKYILGAYVDEGSTSVLYKTPSCVIRLSYREGFPVMADTLIATATNEFRSIRFRTSYFIGENTIGTVLDQKIIHPCSNWQGQTPWKEVVTGIYTRVDQ